MTDQATLPPTTSSAEAVDGALARIREVDRPEIWITLRDAGELRAEAARLDSLAGTTPLPLRGLLVAVKDNIDVAGLPTTAGCPGYAHLPEADAPAVARLRAAGAIVLGKTNLDQFATGLVGTRSPYGAVRNARLPELISGGSSSGSAVAVALGIADLALGTDTAGSGRVPAALNAIVGIKPTLGTVPTTGMLDACRPFDTITVFARTVPLAVRALDVVSGADGVDPRMRAAPGERRLAARDRPVLAIPSEPGLAPLTPAARVAWDAAVQRLSAVAELREIDVAPLLGAAKLLYEGAIVAGRYAAAGAIVETAPEADLDPTVASIVRGARAAFGWEYVRDQESLDRTRLHALAALAGCDALVIPTAPAHPSLAEVAAAPIAVNSHLGSYTNFVNLLDLAAIAVPAGRLGADGEAGDFGISFVTRPFEDQVGFDLAQLFLGAGAAAEPVALLADDAVEPIAVLGDDAVELAVFGAHLRGQVLNHELTERGARFVAPVRTAPRYGLFALDTTPPKPGLVPVPAGGASIEGELWRLTPAALGSFLAALPAPMTLGAVTLDDDRTVVGFGCSADALAGAADITAYGSWPAYLGARAQRAV